MDADIGQMVEYLTRGALELSKDANWPTRYTRVLVLATSAIDDGNGPPDVPPWSRSKALAWLDEATSLLAGSFGLNPLPKWTQKAVYTMDDILAEEGVA